MSEGWNQRDGKEDRPRTRSGEFKPRLSILPSGTASTNWAEWDRRHGNTPETAEERAARLAAEAPEPRSGRRQASLAAEPNEPRAATVGRGGGRYAGKQLWCTKAVNPRRPGSHGFRSLAIIIEQPGITYEQYLRAGGRLNDLTWDDEHNNVKFNAD